MALTSAQLNDSIYLTNMINNLRRQKEESLRENEVTKNMNLRLLRQTNALNGLNGGIEESNYARLLAGANKGAAAINAQFDPQIAEYQSYYDALLQRGASGGGGSRRKKKTTATIGTYTTVKKNPSNYTTDTRQTYANIPSALTYNRNMVK